MWRFDGSIGRHWSEDPSRVFRIGWFHVRSTWWPLLPTILEEEDLAGPCSQKKRFRQVSRSYAKYMLKRSRPAEDEQPLVDGGGASPTGLRPPPLSTKRPRIMGAEGRPGAGTEGCRMIEEPQ